MRILVIRRDNIGDLVCATPLLSALRRRYPQAHIAVLANSYNAGVLAGNPDIDAIHAYTKVKHRGEGESWLSTLLATFRLLRALRRQRFDYAVLAKAGFDKHGLALARRIAPGQVVGFLPPGKSRAAGITSPAPPAAFNELHEVEVMMKLGERLGARGPAGALRVTALPERVEQWRRRLPELSQAGRRWVAVHISAREPGRVWPEERYAALIDRLGERHNVGVVLLWAPGAPDDARHPGDNGRAATILERTRKRAPVVAAPTHSLEDLAAVLSLCQAFVGPDGGAMHMAAGVGLPVIALFENHPYKKRHWYPWGVPYEMVCPPTRDIADIEVDAVEQAWAALEKRL